MNTTMPTNGTSSGIASQSSSQNSSGGSAQGTFQGSGNPPHEKWLDGQPVADGIAIGQAYIRQAGALEVPHYRILKPDVETELQRFDTAVARSQKQLQKLQRHAATLPDLVEEEIGYLLDAHVQILTSPRLLDGVRQRIQQKLINAEAAVKITLDHIISAFGVNLQDELSATHAQEIREVGARLVRNLTHTPFHSLKYVPPNSIILADDLTPADLASILPENVHGLALVAGRRESHTSIMARSLQLPLVARVNFLLDLAQAGDTVIVDGQAGKVILCPSPATLAEYKDKQERQQKRLARAQSQPTPAAPALTKDGTPIHLYTNLETPRDWKRALSLGAEGVGLFRTEFCIMGQEEMPTAPQLLSIFKDLLQQMDGRPLTIRLFDLGADKPAAFLPNTGTPPLNPALGLRGIRLLLKHPELLDIQLRAILQARQLGDVRLLLPMVTEAEEVTAVRERLQTIATQLAATSKTPLRRLPVGAMIEVPAAIMMMEQLVKVCDFFAIGSNDLTQYTLAADRMDEDMADLYNSAHPAVMKLITHAVTMATKAKRPISLCGELAGQPEHLPHLIKIGLRHFSMAPIYLPTLREAVGKIKV